MGVWEDSPFAQSGAELEIQDTVVAIERVLDNAPISEMSRRALLSALEALRADERHRRSA